MCCSTHTVNTVLALPVSRHFSRNLQAFSCGSTAVRRILRRELSAQDEQSLETNWGFGSLPSFACSCFILTGVLLFYQLNLILTLTLWQNLKNKFEDLGKPKPKPKIIKGKTT